MVRGAKCRLAEHRGPAEAAWSSCLSSPPQSTPRGCSSFCWLIPVQSGSMTGTTLPRLLGSAWSVPWLGQCRQQHGHWDNSNLLCCSPVPVH